MAFAMATPPRCEARAAKPHVPRKLKRGYLKEAFYFYAEARLVFHTYSTLKMARRLCFACSTNTAESGNGVLWLGEEALGGTDAAHGGLGVLHVSEREQRDLGDVP